MRDISEEAKALALAPARRISARAIVTHLIDGQWGTDGDIYNQNDKVQSLSISLGSNSGGFTVGETYCGKLTLTLIGDDLDIRQDDRIHIVLGFFDDIKGAVTFKSTYSGYFFVDKITRNKKQTTVVAFDKMLRFSKNYISKLTYPALLSEMLEELSGQCSTELADDVTVPCDAQIKAAPIKGTDSAGKKIYYTRREMLGYCAALCGSSFYMDNNGKLALVTNADCGETILPENTTSETHEPLEYEVTDVVWSAGGNSISRDDDADAYGIVEFANPLDVSDKEQVLNAISAKIVGLKYFEAAIKGQGKGWYELGDIVSVKISDSKTLKIRISGITYEVKNGAFTETLYSSALTESQSNYTSGDVSGGTYQPTSGGTGAGTLAEYNVLSDNSVKYNGITYTAERAESGLISKISDDKGGEFEPTFADGVTDIALHNAAFLAVAMLSGLKHATSGWILTNLIHQNKEVVTAPKSFDTGITAEFDEYTIEICMQFNGLGNSSSNQSSTLFHTGGLSSAWTALKIASCDYHPEALDYQIFGYWHFDTVGDYTTFPSHKGELSTITLTVRKIDEHDSEVKVYSNGELRSTKGEGWYYVSLSNYMVLNAKDMDRTALGTVYQVRIYNRALTDEEVAQNASEDRRCYG